MQRQHLETALQEAVEVRKTRLSTTSEAVVGVEIEIESHVVPSSGCSAGDQFQTSSRQVTAEPGPDVGVRSTSDQPGCWQSFGQGLKADLIVDSRLVAD